VNIANGRQNATVVVSQKIFDADLDRLDSVVEQTHMCNLIGVTGSAPTALTPIQDLNATREKLAGKQ
jgi:hypothetical protein